MAFLSRWRSYPRSFDRENNEEGLNWRLYAGGALMEVADSAILTEARINGILKLKSSKPAIYLANKCLFMSMINFMLN